MMQASHEGKLDDKMLIEHRDDIETCTAKCLIKLEDGLPADQLVAFISECTSLH